MSNLEVLLNSLQDLRDECVAESKSEDCGELAAYYRGRAGAYGVVCSLLKKEIDYEKKSR